ncbi:hypothetical protein ACFRCI_44865 [Streptomyces sp. NPDC056638]|uniref:hypothetical protein n=1 Tax=Streptomyces sp. NPDC056638 TaxID=3345887 RepID=UPI0036CB2050
MQADLAAPEQDLGERVDGREFLGAVATRYDERGCAYLGTATAAALIIWLRTLSTGQVLESTAISDDTSHVLRAAHVYQPGEGKRR